MGIGGCRSGLTSWDGGHGVWRLCVQKKSPHHPRAVHMKDADLDQCPGCQNPCENPTMVLGMMWVFPQVLSQDMPLFWCLLFLGGLLPPSQGFLNLLKPAQPSGGEFRYFLCFQERVMAQSCAILGSWHVPLLIRELPPGRPISMGNPALFKDIQGSL